MRNNTGDTLRIAHILESIETLQLILKNTSFDTFYANIEKRLATERLLEIIGEAISNISDETLNKSSIKIEWRKIKAFRNFVAHEYFRVDAQLVYSIATNEIIDLKNAMESISKINDD
jgi:uncharacterized protein with HEPN domain